jgi:hypothetical protein
MDAPSSTQVRAALETLAAAGFSLTGPATARLQLIGAQELARLMDWSAAKARSVMQEAEHFRAIRLPGGDLRVRLTEVEAFIERHEVGRMAEKVRLAA